jgi:hypothetical protein
MLIREFNIRHKRNLPETVLYAGEMLERSGFIFMIDFGTENAIDIAATEYTKWLDDLHYWEFNGH